MGILADRVCLVTGASRGIGRGIALAFAREGARLVITGRDRDRLCETEESLRSLGCDVTSVAADITHSQEFESVVDAAVGAYGRLDVACNNAGVSSMAPALDITPEDWDYNMHVNAKATFFACQTEAKRMVKQGDGKIINIASLASKRGLRLLAHYCASKHAVIGFSRSLALELAENHITVNCICPGLVKTEMQEREIGWEAALRNLTREDVIREYIETTPLGRLEMPEDVAKVAVFLASSLSDFLTGQAINVTGGIEMN